MFSAKVLDVGCGSRPKGDVNVDLRQNVQANQHLFMSPQEIPNFIFASGERLPFRDYVFSEVLCYHVIEHVKEPTRMLFELIRVANGEVTVKCPHRMSQHPWTRPRHHRNFFNKSWFNNTLRKHPKVRGFYMEITKWQPFPNYLISLLTLPHEITVTIHVYLRNE